MNTSELLGRAVAVAHSPITAEVFARRMRPRIVGLDRHAPLHGGATRPYVNLDNAATTPALRDVTEGVTEFLEWYGSVHRGTGAKSLISTRAYDDSRRIVAEFVGADPDYHTVLFTCSATGGLNKVAHQLAHVHGGKPLVLCTMMEHHSNMLPWREHCRVDYVEVNGADGTLDMDHLQDRLRKHDGQVRLVAVCGASNVTGLIPPLRSIARMAHEHGAEMLVDGAQLVPHRRVLMGAPDDPERIDYLAFSGHKMYAPFGSGVLVGPKRTFSQGAPDNVGGGTVRLVTLDEVLWADLPEREEPGTPNAVGAVALARATSVLRETGMENIGAHETALRRRAVEGLRGVPGIHVFSETAPAEYDRVGVVGFTTDGVEHALLASALGHEWGVAVRHGCFCAHPYIVRLLGVPAEEVRRLIERARADDHAHFPGLVRLSLGMYNTAQEIDYAIGAIRSIIEEGPHCRYELDRPSGEFLPQDSPIELDPCFRL